MANIYDPRLPVISQIEAKYWKTMVSRKTYLSEVFKRPPITAYRRQPNLRSLLIKAKLPSQGNQQRVIKGMKNVIKMWVMSIHKRNKECKD